MTKKIKLKPLEVQKISTKIEWVRFITQYNPTHIITLTFANKSDRSTQHINSDIVNKFIYQLNNIIYGKKSRKAHKCAVFSELDFSNRKHYHILIETKFKDISDLKVDKLIKTYCNSDISSALYNPEKLEDLIYLEIIKKIWVNIGILKKIPTGTANFKEVLGVNEGFKRIGEDKKDFIKIIDYVLKNEPSISTNNFSKLHNTKHEGFIASASNKSGTRN